MRPPPPPNNRNIKKTTLSLPLHRSNTFPTNEVFGVDFILVALRTPSDTRKLKKKKKKVSRKKKKIPSQYYFQLIKRTEFGI